MFTDSWNVLASGFVIVSSEFSWIFFISFVLFSSKILASILNALILDVFLASLEFEKLKDSGKKSVIESRIDELFAEGYDVFTKKSGLKRLWRVRKSKYASHLNSLECIFVEELLEDGQITQVPQLHLFGDDS